MSYAEECKHITDSVRAVKDNRRMIEAEQYYKDIKPLIMESADAGRYYYSFSLDADIHEQLTEVLEKNGFTVEAEIINDCGHFYGASMVVRWNQR